MSDFFEPPSPSRFKLEMRSEEWMEPPRTVLPAIVPVERVIAKTDGVAVYIDNLWAYPNGFELDVFAVANEGVKLFDPMLFEREMQARQEGKIPPEKLRVGFEFADGSAVSNLRTDEDMSREPPRMSSTRGTYGEDEWEQSYWIWPLPPPGPLTLVCEWPGMEIPLTRVELDAQAIIDAAPRAQQPFPAS